MKITKKLYYGWVIVFIAGFTIFFSAPGQTYSISAFIDSYINEFNFTRTSVSTIYSFATIISGSLLVFMGKLIDRFGQKKMSLLVGLSLALTCLFNSFITNIFMMSIGFFLLRYFGQGSMTLIPNSLIPQWFIKRRALTISLANIGNVAANSLVPLLNVYLISKYSWQNAWRFWSIALVVVFIPIAYTFIVNRPEDIALLPDNKKIKDQNTIKDELKTMTKDSWHLNEALKTKEFWFVGFISMIAPMISTGLMFHYFSIMSQRALFDEKAAVLVGLMALPGFLMPIISGLIIDRYRSKHILTMTLFVIASSLVFFVFSKSFLATAIFMIVYGFAVNIQSVTISVIWPRYFGRKYLGSIRGAATVFSVFGSALGPIPFGISFDMTQSYNPVFIMMTLISILSIAMAVSIQKPKKVL